MKYCQLTARFEQNDFQASDEIVVVSAAALDGFLELLNPRV